jgi:hypothetical protein
MDHLVEQQTQRIEENMPFFAVDPLACVITLGSMRAPLFSARFTLWLSMMAAVGLVWRSPRLRHSA